MPKKVDTTTLTAAITIPSNTSSNNVIQVPASLMLGKLPQDTQLQAYNQVLGSRYLDLNLAKTALQERMQFRSQVQYLPTNVMVDWQLGYSPDINSFIRNTTGNKDYMRKLVGSYATGRANVLNDDYTRKIVNNYRDNVSIRNMFEMYFDYFVNQGNSAYVSVQKEVKDKLRFYDNTLQRRAYAGSFDAFLKQINGLPEPILHMLQDCHKRLVSYKNTGLYDSNSDYILYNRASNLKQFRVSPNNSFAMIVKTPMLIDDFDAALPQVDYVNDLRNVEINYDVATFNQLSAQSKMNEQEFNQANVVRKQIVADGQRHVNLKNLVINDLIDVDASTLTPVGENQLNLTYVPAFNYDARNQALEQRMSGEQKPRQIVNKFENFKFATSVNDFNNRYGKYIDYKEDAPLAFFDKTSKSLVIRGNRFKELLDPYLSRNDKKILNSLIDDKRLYQTESVELALSIASHLRNLGIQFRLDEKSAFNTLNVLFDGPSGSKTSLRIYDNEPLYIGAIFSGGLRYHIKLGFTQLNVEDVYSMIDYALGRKRLPSNSHQYSAKTSRVYDNSSKEAYVFGNTTVKLSDDASMLIEERYSNGRRYYPEFTNNKKLPDDIMRSYFKLGALSYAGLITGSSLELVDANLSGRQVDFIKNVKDALVEADVELSDEQLRERLDVLNNKISNVYQRASNQFNFNETGNKDVDIYINTTAVDALNAQAIENVAQDGLYGIEFDDFEAQMLKLLISDGLEYQSYNPAIVEGEGADLLYTFDTIDKASDLSNIKVDLDHLITGTYGRYISNESLSNDILNTFKHSTLNADNLYGSDYTVNRYKDMLITFDDSTARNAETTTSDAERKVLEFVQNELISMSIVGDTNGQGKPIVEIDDNGIISYTGYRPVGGLRKNSKVNYNKISGHIGQVFLPNDKGMIYTKFGSDNNFAIVPSYRGYFQFDGMDEGVSRMDRFRVEGFEQTLYSQLSMALHRQLETITFSATDTPESTTMLNKLYTRDLLKMKFDYDWYEKHDLDKEIKDRVIQTLSRKVRLDNELGEMAGSFAEVEETLANKQGNLDYTPDVLYKSVDNRNIRVIDEDYVGYFDSVMTGTNRNQGLVLYIGDGVEINEDGRLTPVIDENGNRKEVKAPIRELDEFQYQPYNAWDRNQMASNQILTASTVAPNSNVLMDAFGGWTHEDSAVVSKKFAQEHMVKGEDGEMRPLRVGDKISDFGGNKATISLVVDPDLDIDDARLQGLEMPVEIFAQNPNLDVVMSPYSVISRCNAGVIHELVNSSEKYDITYYNDATGEVKTIGKTGQLNIIVTDMLVDKKSHVYTEADIRDGKGRKASGQLGWAALENNLDDSINIFWGNNDSAIANLREYMLVTGLDIAADGTLQVGYHAHDSENRPVINIKSLYDKNKGANTRNFDIDAAISEIGSSAGILELPFDIELVATDADGKKIKTNQLPIMSAAVRTNRVNIDDNLEINNYTRNYADIISNAYRYIQTIQERVIPTQEQIKELESKGDLTSAEEKELFSLREMLSKQQTNAENLILRTQQKYNVFAHDVIHGKLGGLNGESDKRSYIRTDIMGKRMRKSATLVITADPRLTLDGVAISPEVNETFARRYDNDRVAIHRDPCLRGAAITGVKIERVDDKMTGIAINPLLASKMNGDFDGDSVGVWCDNSRAFQKEVRNNLSLANNFIDPTTGNSPIIDISMGYISAAVAEGVVTMPQSDDDMSPADQLNAKVMELYSNADNHEDGLRKVDYYLHDIINNRDAFGCSAIDVTNRETALASLNQIVESGAKGSPKALAEFTKYYDGQMGAKEARDIQRASGIKSDLTGLAGSYSQKLTQLLRDVNPALGLEITYPATQATLQIKHNAALAEDVAIALSVGLRSYLNGYRPNDKKRNPINRDTFVNGLTEVFESTGIKINDAGHQRFSDLANLLMDPHTHMIRSVDDLVQGKYDDAIKASPLDLIAYSGGFGAMNRLANDGRSLAEGKNTSKFLPKDMVGLYNGQTHNEKGEPYRDVLLKKDVRLTEEEVKAANNLDLADENLMMNDNEFIDATLEEIMRTDSFEEVSKEIEASANKKITNLPRKEVSQTAPKEPVQNTVAKDFNPFEMPSASAPTQNVAPIKDLKSHQSKAPAFKGGIWETPVANVAPMPTQAPSQAIEPKFNPMQTPSVDDAYFESLMNQEPPEDDSYDLDY